jgi:hypothetical protein
MMDDAPVAAPVAQREFSDIEIARMLGRVLTLAARRLDLPIGKEVGLDTLGRAILQAARAGGLEPDAYRIVWWVLHGPERIACVEP